MRVRRRSAAITITVQVDEVEGPGERSVRLDVDPNPLWMLEGRAWPVGS